MVLRTYKDFMLQNMQHHRKGYVETKVCRNNTETPLELPKHCSTVVILR